MGILSLARRYERERLEAACDRALTIGAVSYSSVNAILKAGVDKIPPATRPAKPTPAHGNIRGGSYFCCITMARVRICPPVTMSPIFICTRSQPRNLLSIARSNRALFATIRMRTCDDQDEKRDRDFGMLVGQFVAGKA